MNVIEEIETLYTKSEYSQALNLLRQENISSLPEPDQMHLIYYQVSCHIRLSQIQEALNIALEGKNKFQTNQANYGYFALELAHCNTLREFGKLTNAIELLADAIERSKQVLYETNRGKRLLAVAYNNMFVIKQRKGESEPELLSYLTEALKLSEEIGDKMAVAVENLNIGGIYNNSGDTPKALQYIKESLLKFEELGNSYQIAGGYERMGILYGNLAELDLALEYLQKALKINKENDFPLYQNLADLGWVYYIKGDFITAENYFFESLTLAEKGNHIFIISEVLINLMQIYHYTKDSTAMSQIVDRIKMLPDDSILTKSVKLLSEGLYYLEQDQMRDKLKSIAYFEDVMNIKDIPYSIHFIAICSLCELNILELKITPSESTLKNTVDQVNQLYRYSKERNAPEELIQALILLSKLCLLDGDIEKAEAQLNEALMLATEKGISNLIQDVETEKNKLLADLKKWQKFISGNSSIIEKLEFSEFEDYLKNAKQMASFFK